MSKVTKDFLFELGTEELPPKALKKLSQSLLASVESQLKEAKIDFAATKWFASPRRLSFIIFCYFVWAPTFQLWLFTVSSLCFMIFMMQNRPYLND